MKTRIQMSYIFGDKLNTPMYIFCVVIYSVCYVAGAIEMLFQIILGKETIRW